MISGDSAWGGRTALVKVVESNSRGRVEGYAGASSGDHVAQSKEGRDV